METGELVLTIDAKQLFSDENDIRQYMQIELPVKMEEVLVATHGVRAVEQILKYARVHVNFVDLPEDLDVLLTAEKPYCKDAIYTGDVIASYYAGTNPND